MKEWVESAGRILARDGDDSLRDLMIEYQQGSAPAAEALVERLSPALLRFFQSADWSRNRAEDLLQEFWMRLHCARHTYSPEQRLLPWVFAIARHTRVDGFRRYRRRSREVSIEETTARAVVAQPSRSDGDFERLLSRLPESQREVILMLKLFGLTLEEVARATSSTVGAVKQKAHRDYETLRRFVAEGSRTWK
jgi:RNA polymerase sigma-70 factor (ECF subfamily)